MKKLTLFFLLLFIQNAFSQRAYRNADVISGEITINHQPENNFKIFVFDSRKNPKNSVLKYDSHGKTNEFYFELSPSETNLYRYIEIATTQGAKIFTLKSLSRKVFSKINFEKEVNINLTYEKVRDSIKKVMIEKPAIYLYPQKESQIQLLHHFKGKITTTYPLYNKGWNLLVNPEGKIFNLEDKKFYNYLFWEGSLKFSKEHYQYQNGFSVEKKNFVKFLQEKLSILALNNTEINDFIVYWLPEMNKYEKVFVHFWINDNIDNSSILDVNPKPDTSIRVFMEIKEYDNSENNLPEQILPVLKREGFTLVEWGGSVIHSEKIK